MSANGLLGRKMVYICSGNSKAALLGGSAAGAGTVFLYGSEVVGVGIVTEVKCAVLGHGISKALSLSVAITP